MNITTCVCFVAFIQARIQPVTQSVEASTKAQFDCVANGYQSDTFEYQWKLNGKDVRANKKTLIIQNANESDGGKYECIVTNKWGVVKISAPAQLVITSKFIHYVLCGCALKLRHSSHSILNIVHTKKINLKIFMDSFPIVLCSFVLATI